MWAHSQAMNTYSKTLIALLQLVAFAAISTTASAVAIDDWAISTGSTASDLSTASPVIGDGTEGSALNTLIASTTNSQTLTNVGDNISVTGSVTFDGLSGSSLAHSFRWSLMNTNGSTNVNGWLGYVGQNSSGTSPGDLFERDNPNTASWWTTNSATKLGSAVDASSALLTDGTYSLSISVELTATNEVTIVWSLVGSGYSMVGTVVDSSPQTLTFDVIGVGSAGLTADQISLSDMDITYTSVPEASTLWYLVPLLATPFLWRRYRARR
ncbi:MAG: PEP-CTERM sorting domain-containing protein [Puniceicoccales bacterium]